MKKIKIFLAFILCFLFVGCSRTTDNTLDFDNLEPEAIKASVTNVGGSKFPSNYHNTAKRFEKLSEYTTTLGETYDGRVNNIILSSIAIDRIRIAPGEEFSFNDVVGVATPEKGYEKATIFLDGEKVKDYGGGICQVSSTLYNAALEAGLEITERHPHSMKVTYVPEGRDAATSMGSKDLKFINNFSFPIEINSYVGENTFTCEILKVM